MTDPPKQLPEIPNHPFGSDQPRWRLWLARLVIFGLTFALLLTVFSAMGVIVEKFFVLIYTE